MPFSSVFLSEIVKAYNLEVVYDSGDIESRRICVADVTRPGLQLAGYYDHFGPDRIQMIGNMEHAYLDNLSPEETREDGGVPGVSSSCGARGGFLPRHDEDLREPLVRLKNLINQLYFSRWFCSGRFVLMISMSLL